MKVAVIGSTGNNASACTGAFLRRGFSILQLVRQPSPADHGAIEPRYLDLDDPASYQPALNGADILALVSPSDPRQVTRETGLIRAAELTGIKRIVKLSVAGAGLISPVSVFARWHAQIEEVLRASSIPNVILRPNFFMQNILRQRSSISDGIYINPHGSIAAAYIDALDIAEVAAVAARGDDDGTILTLTGPEVVTGQDIRAEIENATRGPVHILSPDPSQIRSLLTGQGTPQWLADAQYELCDALRRGNGAHVSEITATVEEITGKPARTLRTFAEREFGHQP
jgi:uncharacterized protein YbjT (DUF2867 family)